MLSERIVKVRLCKRCPHSCNMQPPIVGCLSVYVPYRHYNVCIKRVWFTSDFRPVDYWRAPTNEEMREKITPAEWRSKLRLELMLLKLKEKEVNERIERE